MTLVRSANGGARHEEPGPSSDPVRGVARVASPNVVKKRRAPWASRIAVVIGALLVIASAVGFVGGDMVLHQVSNTINQQNLLGGAGAVDRDDRRAGEHPARRSRHARRESRHGVTVRLDHHRAHSGEPRHGVPDLAPTGHERGDPAVRGDALRRRHREDQRRIPVRQRKRRWYGRRRTAPGAHHREAREHLVQRRRRGQLRRVPRRRGGTRWRIYVHRREDDVDSQRLHQRHRHAGRPVRDHRRRRAPDPESRVATRSCTSPDAAS